MCPLAEGAGKLDMEHVTSNELRAARLHAVEEVAPVGGEREIAFNTACEF